MHDQQVLFNAEDSISWRNKIRSLRQKVADLLTAQAEARSKYALVCSQLKEAQRELDAALAADCVTLPLFDRPLTPEQAKAAYDAATPEPLSQARIEATVESATAPVSAPAPRLPDVPPRARLVADITVEGFACRIILTANGWHQVLADLATFGTWHDGNYKGPHRPSAEQVALAVEKVVGLPAGCIDHWPEEDQGVMVFEVNAQHDEIWRRVEFRDHLSQRQRSLLYSLPAGSVDTLGELEWWLKQGNNLPDIPGIKAKEVGELADSLRALWHDRTMPGGRGEYPDWLPAALAPEPTRVSAPPWGAQEVVAEINAALLSALYHGQSAEQAWAPLIQGGASDDDIKATLASEWLTPCCGSDHGGWYARGGKGAGFWHGAQGPMGKALLSGKALIARVRKVLSIGQKGGGV